MQYIRLKSNLNDENLLKKAKERAPKFRAIPGLLQKYYIRKGDEGLFGGVYIWDSEESLNAFRDSELAASISDAYESTEVPHTETLDILFQLRD